MYKCIYAHFYVSIYVKLLIYAITTLIHVYIYVNLYLYQRFIYLYLYVTYLPYKYTYLFFPFLYRCNYFNLRIKIRRFTSWYVTYLKFSTLIAIIIHISVILSLLFLYLPIKDYIWVRMANLSLIGNMKVCKYIYVSHIISRMKMQW